MSGHLGLPLETVKLMIKMEHSCERIEKGLRQFKI